MGLKLVRNMDNETEITKEIIIKTLRKNRRQLTTIINGFLKLDQTNDARVNRQTVTGISLTLFELIDSLSDINIDIYNFMRRRG